jgi:phage gp36-like protein
MAYIEQSELKGLLPEAFIIEALDDDEDGAADAGAWAEVAAGVQEAIDGPLSMRFPTPFAEPLPKILKRCARYFAVELLYSRRGLSDKNPHAETTKGLHALLRAIARREAELSAGVTPNAGQGGAVLDEPTRTGTGGMIL